MSHTKSKNLEYDFLLLFCYIFFSSLVVRNSYSTAQHSIAQYSIAQHNIAWHSIAQYSIAQQSVAQYSIAQPGIAQHSTLQHSILYLVQPIPGSATFFSKGQGSNYFRLCGLYDICLNYSALPLQYKRSHRQHINRWI